MASSDTTSREGDIRRKINELKREGRIKRKQSTSAEPLNKDDDRNLVPLEKGRKKTNQLKRRSVADEYAEKLSSKLVGRRGRQVGRMMGIDVPISSSSGSSSADAEAKETRKPKLGALDVDEIDEDDDLLYPAEEQTEEERRDQEVISTEAAEDAISRLRDTVDRAGKESEADRAEEDMIDAVAAALSKRGDFRSQASLDVIETNDDFTSIAATPPSGQGELKSGSSSAPSRTRQTTSGIGGTWDPPAEKTEDYQPKVGTWGAFPRPRNISAAYGGGKRVGAGVKTDEKMKQGSVESTRDRLRAYREKVGIEVQSEKDNAAIIEEALTLAGRAMQRGSYGIGVSALEKVTQFCSTKSKVGGKVFLELAMAYEAEGKTDQAIGLYEALTKSPIEQIKMNADKLLYGLEAMNFMRNEAKLEEFSRKNAANTFIDATGFGDISKNFKDSKIYNTAYIDLNSKGSRFYKMLTENVVRSTREARQILLKAVSAGAVERMKIVQALRSISRNFDDALIAEEKQETAKNVPVDYAGRPIVSTRQSSSANDDLASAIGMDGFILGKPEETLGNLNGEWRLQLMADKRGEGMDFFNSTTIWQVIDSSGMTYTTSGFRSSSQSGELVFSQTERVLSRQKAPAVGLDGVGFLLRIFDGGSAAAADMVLAPQQVLSVDPALLITRAKVEGYQGRDNIKKYYSVWRRVEPGSYSGGSPGP